jgi:hypothetical protein
LRVVLALIALLVAGTLVNGGPASAASGCPTQTFLSYNHLAYEATAIPASVSLPAGRSIGSGTVDEPTNANGCRRNQKSGRVLAAGSIQPQVAVLVSGEPGKLFVLGHRCTGFAGSGYWDCLLHPLVFRGRRYTATSYPSTPAPRRTLPLAGPLGTAPYQGHPVTIRRLQGIADTLAVGIAGQPSVALLTVGTCPYSGFSNNPLYDNLLHCLRSPVWFTFDPPGNQVGNTVVARSDRALPAAVAGAAVSLVSLPVVADFVPANHSHLVPVGHVAGQFSLQVPNVPAGLYEAVVSCPRCGSVGGVAGLYPAGSVLVTSKPKTSTAIQIISYVLAALVVVAAILAFRTWRRRRQARAGAGGPGPGRSSRR